MIAATALLTVCAIQAVGPIEGPRSWFQPGPLQRAAGWQSLLDENFAEAWSARKLDGWRYTDGVLQRIGPAGDLLHHADYGDFELTFDWRITPGGNSGVKVRVQSEDGSAIGPEYQILDDKRHSNGLTPRHSAAALYDLSPAHEKSLRPTFEFNRGLIRATGPRIEHWLNGTRVLAVDLESADFSAAKQRSKFSDRERFGLDSGRVLLQDHGDEVWYRRVWIRDFAALSENRAPLFDGQTLDNWRVLGDAIYEVEDGGILGRIGGGGQSFLVSRESYGDFVLELELKPELPGNSGIQIRSHQRENGRLYGYQIEIDSSERAWSGGLYDEARRGWLDDLKDNPQGRAAFRPGEWNEYRIECNGPWIRAWVNGVPTADYLDAADLEGIFGLQVHSGNNTRVHWRNVRLWDLGGWEWVTFEQELGDVTELPDPFVGLRLHDVDATAVIWVNGVAVDLRGTGREVEILTNGARSVVTIDGVRRALAAPLDVERTRLEVRGPGKVQARTLEILRRRK